MLSILAFLYGASVGSFVQVIASRLHVAPIIKGRSKCLSCGEALRVLDLVPLLSYIFLRGKCRYCKSVYGISALIIELLFGITFLLLYQVILSGGDSLLFTFGLLVYYSLLIGVLGVMALYDRAHSFIPSSFLLLYLLLVLGMFVVRIVGNPSVLTVLSPVFVMLPFLLIWVITKGKGVGFGDVIIFFGVGAYFGSLKGFAVLMISVWVGAIFGLGIKYLNGKKKVSLSSAMPFIPFIVFAFLVVLFTDIDVFSIASIFS